MDPDDADSGPFWSYVRDVDTASSLVQVGVVNPGEDDGDGNIINADLTPTVSFDRTLDLFIGTDTTIDATAVLTGDTDHNYMPLTTQQDPVLNYYDGFITDWKAPTTAPVIENPVIENPAPSPGGTGSKLTINFADIVSKGGVQIDDLVHANGDSNVHSSDAVVLATVQASTSLTTLNPDANVLVFSGDNLEAANAMDLETAIMDNGYVFSFTQQPPYENDPGMGDGFLAIYDDGANTRSAIIKFVASPQGGEDIFASGSADIIDLGSTLSNVEVDTISASDVVFSSSTTAPVTEDPTPSPVDPFVGFAVVDGTNGNTALATVVKEAFVFTGENGVPGLDVVNFPINFGNGDLLYTFDRDIDNLEIVGAWGASLPASFNIKTESSQITDIFSVDPIVHDGHWVVDTPNATIITFDQVSTYSQSFSGSVGNKMQALMIDTNESGDFDSMDLLLFVDNFGGMIDEASFAPVNIRRLVNLLLSMMCYELNQRISAGLLV